MTKNILCVLLAVCMALTLAACGKKTEQPAPSPTPAASASPTPVADVIPSAVLTPVPTPALTPIPTRSPAPDVTPMPLAAATPRPTPEPQADTAVTPEPVAAANAPVVTKQPNAEGHYIGESAVFITTATNWTSLSWTAVSPSGREIDMKTFRETFPDCTVIGEQDTTLTVTNLNIDMSGWSFYCTFKNEQAETKTESARLRVRDPENTSSGTTGSGSGTAVTTKSKRLHCPGCGSEVPRDLLNCPYCGAEIYKSEEKKSFVTQDSDGDIFYMDQTGAMYYDSSDNTSTYMDTNTNYTVFNESGLIQSGNYNKEQEKADQQAILDEYFGYYRN